MICLSELSEPLCVCLYLSFTSIFLYISSIFTLTYLYLNFRLFQHLCHLFLAGNCSQHSETMSRRRHMVKKRDLTVCLLFGRKNAKCLSVLCIHGCVFMSCAVLPFSAQHIQGQQLCCQDVFKSFLQKHLLCFLSAG